MTGLISSVFHLEFKEAESLPMSEYIEKFDIAHHISSPNYMHPLPKKCGADNFEDFLAMKKEYEKRGLL